MSTGGCQSLAADPGDITGQGDAFTGPGSVTIPAREQEWVFQPLPSSCWAPTCCPPEYLTRIVSLFTTITDFCKIQRGDDGQAKCFIVVSKYTVLHLRQQC